MENKVWLVYTFNGFDAWTKVEGVCKSLFAAKRMELKIEVGIQKIKNSYYLKYNSDYDKDLKLLISDGDDYDELESRIILFQAKYPELRIKETCIEEREVE